jgi:hypothetical protein
LEIHNIGPIKYIYRERRESREFWEYAYTDTFDLYIAMYGWGPKIQTFMHTLWTAPMTMKMVSKCFAWVYFLPFKIK